MWDVQSGAELLHIDTDGAVADALWNAAEDRILSGGAHGANLWDAQSGQELAALSTYGVNVGHVFWSADESRLHRRR
ncbi:MAG: hypothetical protein R2911_21855 [Caldilineaceae bacterium]